MRAAALRLYRPRMLSASALSDLARVLLLPLVLHSCATGMRFTATLDALDSGAGPFAVGSMLATISLVPALVAVRAGRRIDERGAAWAVRTAMAAAMLSGVAALALPRAAAGLAPLFVSCLLAGLSFMLTNTAVQRLAGDVAGGAANHRTAFTALSLVTASSNLATPVAAGHLIEHVGFIAPYVWCVAAPSVLLALCALPGMRRVLARHVRRGAEATAGSGRGVTDFLKDPPMRAVLVASVIINVAWEVGNLLIPVYASGAGLSPSDIGWVLGSFAAATFVVRFLMPLLLKRLSEWRMIAATLALASAAFAAMPLLTSLPGLMAAAFVLGLGLGASLPNMMALVYLFAPGNRIGEAIGLRIMLINAGRFIFPVLAGAAGSVVGAGASLLGLALFTAGGFAYALSASRDVLGRMRALREPDGE